MLTYHLSNFPRSSRSKGSLRVCPPRTGAQLVTFIPLRSISQKQWGENPTSGRAQVCNVNVIRQSASKIGSTALRRAIPFSAAGIDGIPTSVLDPMGPDWFKHYQLTQPSMDWQCRPLPLHIFCIIIAPTKALKVRLFKVKFKAWRLITLLHTLEKAIESVAANILSTLAKQHGLLPTPTPTGGRPCGTIYHHCSRFPFNPDACH